MSKWMVVTAMAVAVALLGCRKEPDLSAEEQAQAAMAEISELMMAAQESGSWGAALERLQVAFTDESLVAKRSEIFRNLLQVQVSAGQTNTAVALHLEHLGDAELCQSGCTVLGPVLGQGSRGDLLAWCEELASSASVDWVRQRAWGVLIDEAANQNGLEAFMLERLPAILKDTADVSLQVVTAGTRRLMEADALGSVDTLLAELEAKGAETLPWLPAFVVGIRADLMLARKQFGEVAEMLFSKGALLDDRGLQSRLRTLLDAGTAAEADALVARIFETFAARPAIGVQVGREWVGQSTTIDQFVDRCELFRVQAGVTAVEVSRLITRVFYKMMPAAGPAAQKRMQALLEHLSAGLDGEASTRGQLSLLRLDNAFYLDDWAAALAVLKAGIPEKDEAWVQQITNKVEAHLALSEERYADAIAGFRAFMDSAAEWQEAQANPETGAIVPLGRILGFNAKRIGDIYGKMGQADKQKAAYDEALGQYQQALSETDADSAEYQATQKELDAIPVM